MQGPEILCAGMVVVDLLLRGFDALPNWGETGFVDDVSMALGGDASNQAVALAKLGNQVGVLGMVGDDASGQFVRDQFLRAGVSVEGLHMDPGRTTATGLVVIGRDGEHCFLAGKSRSHADYAPEHIDMSLIRPGLKALSIASLFTSERFDREAVAVMLRRAKEIGAMTFADFVTDQRFYGLDDLAEIWPLLDYVVPSTLEAQTLVGTDDPAMVAQDFRRRGVKTVILKRGALGAMAFGDAETITCPAFRVPLVDTTGAGDNFVAGLVHGMVHGMRLAQTLRFASAVAALSIQAVGAGAGLRDLAQVQSFLQSPNAPVV